MTSEYNQSSSIDMSCLYSDTNSSAEDVVMIEEIKKAKQAVVEALRKESAPQYTTLQMACLRQLFFLAEEHMDFALFKYLSSHTLESYVLAAAFIEEYGCIGRGDLLPGSSKKKTINGACSALEKAIAAKSALEQQEEILDAAREHYHRTSTDTRIDI